MIGSRVKHAKGIGTVTNVGAKGVTVDGEHKIPHGEYQPHEEEHDLPVIAEAYAKWRQRLPEHLAQGPRSKMAVTAALAATLDQHLAGQMDFDELTLHRLQAVIKALKTNKGPHLFSVPGPDGKPVEVGDSDVETYLQGFGLSRRGLEVYHANRSVHDEHGKTGDVGKAQQAAAARVKVSNPGSLIDPRLGPALEARQKRPQAMDAHAGGHRRFAAFTKRMAGGAGDAPEDDSEDDQDPAMTKARPGLALSASKADPSVKRWQKVEQAAGMARPDDAASVAALHSALVRHDPHVAQAAINHSLHEMGHREHPDELPAPASFAIPAAAKRQASMIAKDPEGWHQVLTGAVRHREAAERTAAHWRGEHAGAADTAARDARYERAAAEEPAKAGRHGGHVWMYHGTTDKFLDTVRREGLTTGHKPSNFGSKSSPDKRQQHVYLTTDAGSGPASAHDYARGAAARHGGNPVVLRVRVPVSRLTHDADDADLSVGAHQRRASHVEPHEIMEINGEKTEHGSRLHSEEMTKASDGWEAAPGSQHGAERRMTSGGWEYRYPGQSGTTVIPRAMPAMVAAAHAKLNPHVAHWVHDNSGASKAEAFEVYKGMPDKVRDALHADVAEAVHREHGGDTFTAYRAMRVGDRPDDMGGKSLSANQGRMGRVHAFEVHRDDVMLHYGQGMSHLSGKRFGHEQEIILRPDAKPRHIGEVESPQGLTKAGTMRFYVRMKMTPPTELLKRALRVDVVEEKHGGKTVGAVLTCEGRKWTLKTLAKGGAYLRCEDGLPIPLHVICSGLEDARQVVESTTKRLGEGKAPMRGVFRLDDVAASVPSHVGV